VKKRVAFRPDRPGHRFFPVSSLRQQTH
jgi:hypothetical protein